MPFIDHYAILSVGPDATADQIKSAWKAKARELHPDRNKASDASKRFAEAAEAYETLSDDDRRRRYDAERKMGTQSHVNPSTPWGDPWRAPPPDPWDVPPWSPPPSNGVGEDRRQREQQAQERRTKTKERPRTPDWWEDLADPSNYQPEHQTRDRWGGVVDYAVEQDILEDSYGRKFVFDRLGVPRIIRDGVKNIFRNTLKGRNR
jgi:curved DNA-binding protein CbpA